MRIPPVSAGIAFNNMDVMLWLCADRQNRMPPTPSDNK